MISFFGFLMVISFLSEAAALSCYHCSLPPVEEGRERDMTCLNEPRNITDSVRTCQPHMKACRIVRVEHKESGTIQSFMRECWPRGVNSRDESSEYVTYFRYCSTNLCNKGKGEDGDTGDQNRRVVAILVPDRGSSGSRAMLSIALILLGLILLI